ncbi:MAG TPA: hypothetical protein VJP80_06215 [Candidatus Saccharimonadales bacterium]|nr:hypothetical protein [Candidatus Saccharimonadales bacterium]
MKPNVYRFAGEVIPPTTFYAPLVDQTLWTMKGEYAFNQELRGLLRDGLDPEPDRHDHIEFTDVDESRVPDMNTLFSQFQEVTGLDPGMPVVRSVEVPTGQDATKEVLGLKDEVVERQLQRFYKQTGVRPRPLEPEDASKGALGGAANKSTARIEMPDGRSRMRSFLHELTHCAIPELGLAWESTTEVDPDTFQFKTNLGFSHVSGGLMYQAEDGDRKGSIIEEAVAEGTGTLANRKLHLVETYFDNEVLELPEMVAPYISKNGSFSNSAPAAIAMELIAREVGMPSEQFFKMLADYGTTGVHNVDARAEVAEAVYNGTRGRLTLGQLEELPYPIHNEASLAPLWAVEDALDVPDHAQYSQLFATKLMR